MQDTRGGHSTRKSSNGGEEGNGRAEDIFLLYQGIPDLADLPN